MFSILLLLDFLKSHSFLKTMWNRAWLVLIIKCSRYAENRKRGILMINTHEPTSYIKQILFPRFSSYFSLRKSPHFSVKKMGGKGAYLGSREHRLWYSHFLLSLWNSFHFISKSCRKVISVPLECQIIFSFSWWTCGWDQVFKHHIYSWCHFLTDSPGFRLLLQVTVPPQAREQPECKLKVSDVIAL